jgi:uncharacterized protein
MMIVALTSNSLRSGYLQNTKIQYGFMAKATNDQEFLEYIVKALVDHPDDVKVDRKVDEMGVLLSLTVNPEDMGQIIGRSGSTARAIRNLVRIIGLKNHARVNLKIEEPEGGRAPRQEKVSAAEGLDDLKL